MSLVVWGFGQKLHWKGTCIKHSVALHCLETGNIFPIAITELCVEFYSKGIRTLSNGKLVNHKTYFELGYPLLKQNTG